MPSAHSIVREWRAQRLEDEERILLQERVFCAEEHLKSRLVAGGVTNQEAESLNWRIKNARAELVSRIAQHISQILMFALIVSLQATWFMRHESPPDDRVERVAMAPSAPMPAPPNWISAIGLCSP